MTFAFHRCTFEEPFSIPYTGHFTLLFMYIPVKLFEAEFEAGLLEGDEFSAGSGTGGPL